MTYQLISNGRLLEGIDRQQALVRLSKATRMSIEQLERELLSGTPKPLVRSDDKAKLTRLHQVLRSAGLDVALKPAPDAAAESPRRERETVPDSRPSTPPTAPPRPVAWKRWTLASLALLALCAIGLTAYAWHWLHGPPPAQALAAEDALFDDGLVAIGSIDMEKLMTLKRYWLGELDPGALPLDRKDEHLLKTLFEGPTGFNENLQQIALSLNVPAGEKAARTTVLLSGRFDPATLKKAVGAAYEIEAIDDERWSLIEKTTSPAEPVCENDQDTKTAPTPLYIRVSPHWIMVTDDRVYGDRVWARLNVAPTAHPHRQRWHDYRRGRLGGFAVLAPNEAGAAIGGMPGMLAHQAASETPEVSYVAAGIELAPLQGGLNANIRLSTADSAWTAEAETKIRRELDAMAENGRAYSPALVGLLERVAVQGRSDALDIDVRLDKQLINDMGQVVGEGIAGVLGMGMSGTPDKGQPSPERLDENPRTYANLNLGDLPPFQDQYSSEPPLFASGAFAVNFNSIKPNDDGLLEVWLEGKVGLPQHSDRRFNDIGVLSMAVATVKDAAGNDLLRDERCLGRNDLFGRSPNHEVETNANHHQDHGWVWKHVRLKPGTSVEQIHRIEGRLEFSMPTSVSRFEVPLKAGQVVDHAGLRFYLSRIGSDSVSYQLTGESDRLLEIRALNKDGRALRQGWKMGMDNGQATQTYSGEVHALEIYVAERYLKRKADFVLTDLFRPAAATEDSPSPEWPAPDGIEVARWHEYADLDLAALEVDPKKDWHLWGKDTAPIAEGDWPPIRMFVTHTPRQWGNDPTAHLYFPQLPEIPGVLSAISYRIDLPAPTEGAGVRYHRAAYPYYADSGKIIAKRTLNGKPMAVNNFTMNTGLAENQPLTRLKGELIFRLPQRTRSHRLPLDEAWQGPTLDGITVSITEVSRGTFPGYGLKLEGEIDRLVNLHGVTSAGERVPASPVNFQDGGYWTMTLPFGKDIQEIELVTATEQEVLRYPFDFEARYPDE